MKKIPLLALGSFILATLTMASYFLFFVSYENLRDDPKILVIISGVFAILAVFGAGLTIKDKEQKGGSKFSAALLALLALGVASFFTSYVYHFAYQLPSAKKVIASKTQAPKFSLQDTTGKKRSLEEFKNKKNALLVFFRGDW